MIGKSNTRCIAVTAKIIKRVGIELTVYQLSHVVIALTLARYGINSGFEVCTDYHSANIRKKVFRRLSGRKGISALLCHELNKRRRIYYGIAQNLVGLSRTENAVLFFQRFKFRHFSINPFGNVGEKAMPNVVQKSRHTELINISIRYQTLFRTYAQVFVLIDAGYHLRKHRRNTQGVLKSGMLRRRIGHFRKTKLVYPS